MPRMAGGFTTRHMPSGCDMPIALSWRARASPPGGRCPKSFRGRKIVPEFVRSPPPRRSKPLMAKVCRTDGFARSLGVRSSMKAFVRPIPAPSGSATIARR